VIYFKSVSPILQRRNTCLQFCRRWRGKLSVIFFPC